MFRPLTRTADRAKPRGRRGAILVVVLALLTMFALIALSFLFLAIAEAEIARLHKEAAAGRGGGPPAAPNPDAYVNQCLAGLIFDVAYTDVLNSVRGHSLARGMYGWHGGAPLTNLTPYSGIGPFHEASTAGIDSARWVNYSAIMMGAPGTFTIRDPEWSGSRDQTQVTTAPWAITTPSAKFFIPKNGPWTYPDLNNYALAQLSPATGEVLTPSFVRPWLFTMVPPNAPTGGNPDWLTPRGRVMTVRPRPVDQLTPAEIAAAGPGLNAYIDQKIQNGELIPYPGPNADGTYTGDHQLLTGGVGVQKNDSILMDMGLPVMEWPPNSGKYIKPLVAMLMYDLDGSLDLNSHGNNRINPGHTSFAGYGPWEVNLSRNDLFGAEANAIVQNRFGPGGPLARSGRASLPFDLSGMRLAQGSVVNWDATGSPPAGTRPIQLPQFGGPSPNPFFVRPLFGGAGFFDDNIFDAMEPDKYGSHPGLFNPSDWGSPAAGTPPPMPTTPFTYPLSDLKRLRYRYGDESSVYQETSLAKMTSPPLANLIGTSAAGDTYRLDPAHAKRMLVTTLSADLDRPGLPPNFFSTTPPDFLRLDPPPPPPPPPAIPLPLRHAINPSFGGSFANAPAGSPDFVNPNDWRNQRAALGPIDLNRPLADYRDLFNPPNVDGPGDPDPVNAMTPTPQPLSPTNMGNHLAAMSDRQNFARDIFARLIVATGANATVDSVTGDITIPAGIPPQQFDALRYLAQITVNIVDSIDIDDVNTTFVWNPTDGAGGNLPLGLVNPGNIVSFLSANASNPADIQSRTVMGFEKPRLVINEAYGELTNDPAEALGAGAAAQQPFNVRWFVELLNPTTTAYPPGATGPLGDGTTPIPPGSVTLHDGAQTSIYKLVITRETGPVATALQDPTNVTGSLPAGSDLTYDFSTATQPFQRIIAPADGAWTYTADPNFTRGFMVVGPPAFGNPHTVGAPVEFVPNTTMAPFDRMIVGAPLGMTPNETAMEYDLGTMPPPSAATIESEAFMRSMRDHAVLLRRLANPYLRPNDPTITTPPFPYDPNLPYNPYITVDMMRHVPAFDAVVRGGDATMDTADRMPKAAAGLGAGFEPLNGAAGLRRNSVGKVQPYAGLSAVNDPGAGNLPTLHAFPGSMVVAQNPTMAVPPDGQPLHTFFRQNGATDAPPTAQTYTPTPPALTAGETIMAPFDWLVHHDRPIINPLELLQVQAVKPHEVTQFFLFPPADPTTQTVRRGIGEVPWFGVQTADGLPMSDANTGYTIFGDPNGLTNNGLYRALALLRVKPWTYGEAAGGRTRGKVNLNTMQDQRILRALLDAQAGNNFTQTEIDALWTNFITTATSGMGSGERTVNFIDKIQADGTTQWRVPVAGKTIDDADPAELAADPTLLASLDRPFKPFGISEFIPGPAGTYAMAGGSGIQDTILRMNPSGKPMAGLPRLALGQPPLQPGQNHPYLRDEMARKLLNNTTTVSNVFAVHLRIVYHEVRSDPVNGGPMSVVEVPGQTRYLLGREAFREAPGDMRHDFFAVIDRTKLMVPPGGGQIVAQPFYAAVDNIVNLNPPVAGSTHKIFLSNATISAPGELTVLSDGVPTKLSGTFRLVLGVGSNQEIITVDGVDTDGGLLVGATAPLTKPHFRGELAANGVPGNPGPIGTPLTPNPNNPGPFDVLTNPNSTYRALVPYITQIE